MPVVAIIGPSGAGKSSLVDKYLADHPNAELHKSATTRPQRGADDQAHVFMTDYQFDSVTQSGQFLPPATAYGHRYALPHLPADSSDTLFVLIRHQFVKLFKSVYPDTVVIQVEASLDSLTSRLAERSDSGRDTPDQLEQEIKLGRELADYIISNDSDINTSHEEFSNICNHL